MAEQDDIIPTYLLQSLLQRQQLIVSGETNAKKPPTFSGSEFALNQDPLKFIDDFEEAATWNNWVYDDRKKELFMRCLTGPAKDWFHNELVTTKAAYNALNYDDDTCDSLLERFRTNFVTPQWKKKYEEWYDSRKQEIDESPTHYVSAKRALFRKSDPKNKQKKNEGQLVREIRKGLVLELQQLCLDFEVYPYLPEEQRNLESFASLSTMLSWVERSHSRFMFTPLMDPNDNVGAGQSMDLHPYDANKKLVQPVNAVHNKNGGHKADIRKNGLSPFEKTVLEKLERIENEVTLHKDRLDIHERKIQFMDSNGASFGRNSHNNHPFTAQCYNCKGYGHTVGGKMVRMFLNNSQISL
ncbi:hypothetical protein G6F66_012319 [Rhizopus arrhizus]|nr:hypothetical protein G6F66_012319 [Rhizopus arrhizus]